MNTLKKAILFLLLISFIFNFSVPFASAQEGILPKTTGECKLKEVQIVDGKEKLVTIPEPEITAVLKDEGKFKEYIKGEGGSSKLREALGCAIKIGRIKLFMLPYFVTYLIEFLLVVAGMIAVIFVMYGGFQYVLGGLTEDKESGKKIITHALLGLVIASAAWIVINFIQVALTS